MQVNEYGCSFEQTGHVHALILYVVSNLENEWESNFK